MQVIYADILFVLNVYITYALLLLTSLLTRTRGKRLRLLLASLLSGGYSLVLLFPEIGDTVIAFSRVPALFIILLIAFKPVNRRHFLNLSVGFLGVNFAFFGLMFLLWFFFSPEGMYFNSGIVYFNIDALSLIILTAVCFFVLKFFEKLLRLKAPANTIFDLSVLAFGKEYKCRAFLDTGNSLVDGFTSFPVIVMNSEVIPVPSEEFNFRYIVCRGIGGESLLRAFRPTAVEVRSLKSFFKTDEVLIAVTNEKIKGGSFGAILPTGVFYYRENIKGESYAQEIN